MASKVQRVSARQRITRADGSLYPPVSTPSPPKDWGGLPSSAVYTCPRCQTRHDLDLDAIGRAVWSDALPEKTAYPAFDRIARGHDLECACGLVARLVASIGEYGKMGPYFVVFDEVLELR